MVSLLYSQCTVIFISLLILLSRRVFNADLGHGHGLGHYFRQGKKCHFRVWQLHRLISKIGKFKNKLLLKVFIKFSRHGEVGLKNFSLGFWF